MRLAFVLTEFPTLSETFILNQITGLIDRGHEVEIHASKPLEIKAHPEYFSYGLARMVRYREWIPKSRLKRLVKATWLVCRNFPVGIRVLSDCLVSGPSWRSDDFLRTFYESLTFWSGKSYDGIFCHYGQNGVRMLKLQEMGLAPGPLMTFFHGADITRYVASNSEEVYQQLFRRGSLFLPISDLWKQKLMQLGCPEARIRVHHMGIDTSKFRYCERTPGAAARIKLISVARLVEKKGLEFAIRAVGELKSTHAKDVQYEIIGDGPLAIQLRGLADELRLTDVVTFSGWRDQKYIVAALESANVLLAPSVTAADGDQEGIPVSLMEAMASGLPVVSTYHSGIPELIQSDQSGLLVRERDSTALAKAINRLIEDTDLRRSLSLGARLAIENNWQIDKLNVQLVQFAKEAAIEHQSRAAQSAGGGTQS